MLKLATVKRKRKRRRSTGRRRGRGWLHGQMAVKQRTVEK
jgi:hypothetical protein